MIAEESVQLTVVVAAHEAAGVIGECLDSLERACRGLPCEIVIVHASDPALQAALQGRGGGHVLLEAPRETLVPGLWSRGLEVARGRRVAFTTGHFRVGSGWARALLAALDAGYAGAGGPFRPAPDAGWLDGAIYLLRYSAFLPGSAAAGPVREIAGDNAAYDRAALDRHAASFDEGFWEVEFHRSLRAEGERLAWVPEAEVQMGRSYSLPVILRHRFLHGVRYARDSVAEGERSPWRGILGAPAIPFVLLLRILRRAGRARTPGGWTAVHAPGAWLLASAWALGELVGSARALGAPVAGSR